MTSDVVPLEGHPSDDQKERLEDWLSELMLICRRYGLVLDTDDADTRVVDVWSNTVIGVGLQYIVADDRDQPKIHSYDCAGSILDGAWLVDTPEGPQEQRAVSSPFPHRDRPPA